MGEAAQGVGIVGLHAVAKLIDDEGDDGQRNQAYHFGRRGEEGANAAAAQENGDADGHGHAENELKSGMRHCLGPLIVVLPMEIAHADGYGGRHAIVEHIAQLANGEHHLMGGQGCGANPSHHDARQAEGGRLHAHLQGQRPALLVLINKIVAVDALTEKALPIALVARMHKKQHHQRQTHEHAREHGGQARPKKSHFGAAQMAINEDVVARDVEHVSRNHHHHRRDGVRRPIEELLEGVKADDKGYRHQIDEEIGAHEPQELGWLPQTV